MIPNFLKTALKLRSDSASIENVGPRDSTIASSDISPSPHQAVDSGGDGEQAQEPHGTFVFTKTSDSFADQEQGFAARLKALRTMLNLPASSVCLALGVSSSAYSNYETGVSRPTIKMGVRLAAYFNVTLDYLYLGRTRGLSQRVRKRITEYAEQEPELKQNIR